MSQSDAIIPMDKKHRLNHDFMPLNLLWFLCVDCVGGRPGMLVAALRAMLKASRLDGKC